MSREKKQRIMNDCNLGEDPATHSFETLLNYKYYATLTEEYAKQALKPVFRSAI